MYYAITKIEDLKAAEEIYREEVNDARAELEQLRAKALRLRKTLVKVSGTDDVDTLQEAIGIIRECYPLSDVILEQTLIDIREEDLK